MIIFSIKSQNKKTGCIKSTTHPIRCYPWKCHLNIIYVEWKQQQQIYKMIEMKWTSKRSNTHSHWKRKTKPITIQNLFRINGTFIFLVLLLIIVQSLSTHLCSKYIVNVMKESFALTTTMAINKEFFEQKPSICVWNVVFCLLLFKELI